MKLTKSTLQKLITESLGNALGQIHEVGALGAGMASAHGLLWGAQRPTGSWSCGAA